MVCKVVLIAVGTTIVKCPSLLGLDKVYGGIATMEAFFAKNKLQALLK